MTTPPTPTAQLVAPLSPPSQLPAPRCQLEGFVLELKKGDFEVLREVWVRPNSLKAVIEARRALHPGWAIQATYEIAPWDQQKWVGF